MASVATPLRRYRCTGEGCSWEGTIAQAPGAGARRRLRAHRRALARRTRRTTIGASLALGFAVALAGGVGYKLYQRLLPDAALEQLTFHKAAVPPGYNHDGAPLPPNHPLVVKVSTGFAAVGHYSANSEREMSQWTTPPSAGASKLDAQSPAAAAAIAATLGDPLKLPADSAVSEALASAAPAARKQAPAPARSAGAAADDSLALRKDCAWGDPGRDPYRGTVDQALKAARIPPEIRARLEKMIAAGEATDRLEITSDSIRAVHQRREFDPNSVAMTFGKTLCVNTKVNFKPGHLERADLYEVADASGATYSVMVPYVCGNVSVLGDRAERPDDASDAPILVLGPDGTPVLRRASAPLPGVIAGNIGSRTVVGTTGPIPGSSTQTLPSGQVPEPGTLANLAIGVALLGWFARRRRRAAGRAGEPDA